MREDAALKMEIVWGNPCQVLEEAKQELTDIIIKAPRIETDISREEEIHA